MDGSSCGVFFLAVVVTGVVGTIAVGIGKAVAAHRKAKRRFFESAASRMKGQYFPAGFLKYDRIEYPVGGLTGRVEFVGAGEDDQGRTRIVVPLSGSPGTLHVIPDGFGQSFLKMFGAQDLSVGDRAFDAEYVVKATPESLVAQVFTPERRGRVIATVRGLKGMRDPTIEVTRDQLRVQVREEVQHLGNLVVLAKTAEEFLEYLRITPSATGIHLSELRTPEGSACPVCGTPLAGLIVRCESCKAPHHRECWTYVGQCSTYACNGKRCLA